VFLQIVSGIAIGLLLGTLVGFSQSPVVATVVGALTGALALFLGFNSKSDSNGPASHNYRESAGRICGFGFACTLALVLSLYARTHDSLSVAIESQINALKNAGLLLRMNAKTIADKDDKRTLTTGTVLFAGTGVDACFNFDPKRIPNVDDRISAMRNSDPRFSALADSMDKLDPATKKSMMDGMSRLFCP
jgi:hypothetical protein